MRGSGHGLENIFRSLATKRAWNQGKIERNSEVLKKIVVSPKIKRV